MGGIRSTCTYLGAAQLKELTKRTTFIRVQEQKITFTVKNKLNMFQKILLKQP
jgi:IMP dehydrogenase/GMP reductase